MTTPAIEIQGLYKSFRVGVRALRKEALRGLDLQVERGDLYGFLGPNGAGKSTTIKTLVGLIRADRGQIRILGRPVDEAIREGLVGYLPENPTFYPMFTGREVLLYLARMRGLEPDARKKADEALDVVGLFEAANRKISGYSKGMMQRLAFAQALLSDPDLLILDEPASGLDPLGRYEMRTVLLDLASRGKTVFFSTHIIPDVESIASRVGIIHAGRLVKQGTIEDILSQTSGSGSEIQGVCPSDSARTAVESLGACRWRGERFFVLRIDGDEARVRGVLKKLLDLEVELRDVRRLGANLEASVVASVGKELAPAEAPSAGSGGPRVGGWQ